ncbi:MAG: hypothetical protein ACRDK8_06480 [Solirubrobacteraceae bacterium]
MKRTIGFALVAVAGALLVGCGSTKTVTTTLTQTKTHTIATTLTSTTTRTKIHIKRGAPITTTATVVHTITASSPAYQASSSGQSFAGADTENLGTIHVHRGSELYWSCSGCGNANFIINNGGNDPSQIQVNSLDATSGKTYVDPGTYQDVTIEGSGPWTLSIHPG